MVGHHEKLPYNERDIRSIYHVREYDVHKLMQVEEPIDIFLSHDWPIGITDHGNLKDLLKEKPFFEQEVVILMIIYFILNSFIMIFILGEIYCMLIETFQFVEDIIFCFLAEW